MWDLIVSVPDHCLSFYLFSVDNLILKVDEKAMIRKPNSTFYPRHQSGKERKDEQLELPTNETLPWNDQHKINGGVGA